MFDSVQPYRQLPTRLPHPLDSPGKNTGVGCHFLLQCVKVKVKVKLLSCVRLVVAPWTAAYQAPPSMGFSRQEYWSGLPFPSLLLLSSRHSYIIWIIALFQIYDLHDFFHFIGCFFMLYWIAFSCY